MKSPAKTGGDFCRMMRTIILMMLATLLTGCVVSAKKKAPKSQLVGFSYTRGGGMEVSDDDEVTLRLNDDGTRTLTLSGSCYYEHITFEVDEDVFLRCDSIIHATKMYESKGYYKPRYVLLDAASSGFDVRYADSGEDFYGSGDVPGEIWSGVEVVVDYLKSLRGDREARGHMARQEYLMSTEPIKGTEWIDGAFSYQAADDAEELFRILSQRYGFGYVADEWELQFAEGNGQRCIVLINYQQDIFDVLIDKKTKGVTMADTDSLPLASRRVLVKSEIEGLPTDSLKRMYDLIDARRSYIGAGVSLNDIEIQNPNLINALIQRRSRLGIQE